MSGFGPVVSAAWLAEHLDDPDLVVVDVRWYLDGRSGREAYANGHIDGAVFADLDTDLSAPPSKEGGRHPLPEPTDFAAAMQRLGVSDSSRVVAYDDAGGVIAARLWWMLDVLGQPAAVLDGGISTWTGELVKSSSEGGAEVGARSDFSVRPWPSERIMTKAQMVDVIGTAMVVLDARSPERFAHGGPVDPRPGHIPGARNAPATDNFDDGRFRSATDSRAAYEALGVGSTPTVAYCGSGVTACSDLIGIRLAGLTDAKLYVGSWSAWGADEALPAETGPAEP